MGLGGNLYVSSLESGVGGISKIDLSTEAAKKKVAPAKLAVNYETTVTRTKGSNGQTIKKKVIKRTDKKNVLPLKKVKHGSYTSTYRGVLVDKKGKKLSTTKFSPTETFTGN